MDLLNNINVVIGIIVGLFGIGGYIYGIVTYLRHKLASSQQQTIQRQPPQRNYPQTAPKSLSWMDWMEVLWTGFEDFARARGGAGCAVPIGVGIGGAIFLGFFSSVPGGSTIPLAIFLVIFFTFILLFYVYFVGRRIEEKVEEINRPLTTKSNRTQSY